MASLNALPDPLSSLLHDDGEWVPELYTYDNPLTVTAFEARAGSGNLNNCDKCVFCLTAA